jgi:hypothetical protein
MVPSLTHWSLCTCLEVRTRVARRVLHGGKTQRDLPATRRIEVAFADERFDQRKQRCLVEQVGDDRRVLISLQKLCARRIGKSSGGMPSPIEWLMARSASCTIACGMTPGVTMKPS